MATRIPGLVSGMDTDSLVRELVAAHNKKKDRFVKAQTRLDWKQEAWKTLNAKIYNLYSKTLSNLRFTTGYAKMAASITDPSKASVTADSTAVTGSQTLSINQLAKAGYLTGEKIAKADGTKVTGSTKLSEMGFTASSTLTVNVDGRSKDITVDGDMTINKLVVSLKDAGLSANFDEANQRFFVSSKTSGKDGDFSITAGDADGIDALRKLGMFTASEADIAEYQKWSNYTAAEIQDMINADYSNREAAYTDITKETASLENQNRTYLANIEKANATISISQYKLDYSVMNDAARGAEKESLNAKIAELNQKTKDKTITEDEKKDLAEFKDKLAATTEVDRRVFGDKVTVDQSQAYLDNLADTIANLPSSIATNQANYDANEEILNDPVKMDLHVVARNAQIDIDNAQLLTNITAAYNDKVQTAKDMLAIKNFDPSETDPAKIQAYNDAVARLGITSISGGASKIDGQDAVIHLNGVEFTSNSNNFSINGLSISAKEVTTSDVTITTDTDVDAIYNTIKDFIKEYNALIKEMDTLFNAKAMKGYEPLTDDEKAAMSDRDIEKWEDKLKETLLRRDPTLGSISDIMKQSMSKGFVVNGKTLSLASFGITSLNYFLSANGEKSMLHIDGDPDNSETSGKKDKLRSAIATDQESVVEFFRQLTQDMYGALDKKMKSTQHKSVYTVYNDKQMKREYDDYTKTILAWEKKINSIEDSYYKKFAAMETALAKMQKSTSSLASMMGM